MPRTFPSVDDLRELGPFELAHFRTVVRECFTFFCDYVFWLRWGTEYQWSPLHRIIAYTLHRVDLGLEKRVIINAPPRMGKSETITIYWPSWWFCREPRCNFIETSYSKDLINDMSVAIRDILSLPEIQFLFGVELREDSHAKNLWRTKEMGGLKVSPTKGQKTGFGAGRLAPGFGGAFIISDPVKPADAKSVPAMEHANNTFNSTDRNRLNSEDTPMIVEAQRLADNDLSGFLLGGGSGERWTHVRIPAKIDEADEERARERYKTDWDHGDPVELTLPEGYIWPEKYGPERDEQMSVTPDIRSAQFFQNPQIHGGDFFSAGWFKRYDSVDVDTGFSPHVFRDGEKVRIETMSIFADTAQKKGEQNDYTVFELWGLGEDRNIYLIDLLRGKWEAPELEVETKRFMRRYAHKPPRKYGWRNIYIEDKSSGSSLIQQLRRTVDAPRVCDVQRGTDKVSRAYGCILPISHGRVWIPKSAAWVPAFLAEVTAFSKFDSHKHDDQLDPMFDAIGVLLGKGVPIFDRV
jgi:predicted phage terminase large subunit-like protein